MDGPDLSIDLPLLSVIVPFLNEEKWLPLCLDALDRQTLDRCLFELIFVDNGSHDRSREILLQHGGVQILDEEQRDPYVARNRGIEAARGEYLVFLDADCLPNPTWLQELFEAIRASHPAVILGAISYPTNSSVWLRCYRDYYDQKLEYVFGKSLTEKYFGHAGNMVIRRSVMLELGLFLPMPIVGDSEILHRIAEKMPQPQIVLCPEAIVVHAEVTSFKICLHKVFETGQYSRTLSRGSDYQVLSIGDRVKVLADCIRVREYGVGTTGAMVVTLILGWLAFEAGWTLRSLLPKASSSAATA